MGDWLDDAMDRPREACGVFGVYAPGLGAARMAFFGLYALQHRGQESAGIATTDGRRAYVHKGMGRVTRAFDEASLARLEGGLAVGHTRYSTTGSSQLRNAQPYVIETIHGPLGVAHNGNLTDVGPVRQAMLARGVGLTSSSDSEVLTQLLAAPPPGARPSGAAPDWEARIQAMMATLSGAYALTILTREAVYAVRDPSGLRPLCLGVLPGPDGGPPVGYVAASESCALATVGARYLREVAPGEIVRLDAGGLHSSRGVAAAPPALCVFEYVYFARPDTLLEDQTVHEVRQRLGAALAREAPVEADVVIGVPDSATPAAIGFANEAGLPYTEGLTKNRYIGRTFIQPTDHLRRLGVKLKYNPLRANLEGRRVVLVDDSIVRGTTMGPLVALLREGGAAEVHVRISSPPVRHPCFMGIDMPDPDRLIAHRMDPEEIRRHVGADSLAYLSRDGLLQAVRAGLGPAAGHCSACFDGRYPVPIPDAGAREKSGFEMIQE